MPDSDPIAFTRSDTLPHIIIDIIAHAQWKLYAFVALIFIFISSDIFITNALGMFNGAANGASVTNYGVFLQAMFMVILVIIIDAAISQKII
jgi:hypothetical protein